MQQPRTTLGLDTDLRAALERRRLDDAARTGNVRSLSEVMRDVLRAGLGLGPTSANDSAPRSRGGPRARCGGPNPGGDAA